MLIISKDRAEEIRRAVLAAICSPILSEIELLRNFSHKEWQWLLPWLDTSGVALYFLECLTELRETGILPRYVASRLKNSLAENTVRTNSMFAELKAICLAFDSAGIRYVVLKGVSLWPQSVPRMELRSQLDLDFLVPAKSAPSARQILESRGFHLRAISGRSWEFKTSGPLGRLQNQLYQGYSHRSVEVHIENDVSGGRSLLARAERRCIRGFDMPVLSPADLFIGQGVHLFKHICSEFFRTAHMVEFRRHVVTRHSDPAFWNEVSDLAQCDPRTALAIGTVTLMITRQMGEFAPSALTEWAMERLPPQVHLWVERYGREVICANFPGSKLYLILQQEISALGLLPKRSVRQTLLPLRFPPMIVHEEPDETVWMRSRRYFTQMAFILFRLKFHCFEGARYLRESIVWRYQTQSSRISKSISFLKSYACWYKTVLTIAVVISMCTLLSAQQATSSPATPTSTLPTLPQDSIGVGPGLPPTTSSSSSGELEDGNESRALDQQQSSDQGLLSFSDKSTAAPLSADRIFAILQENPDALIEIKSLMADFSQQQGTPLQADSITDQMLYSKIASSAELRANITTYLQARGYISEDDLEKSADSAADGLFSGLADRQELGPVTGVSEPTVHPGDTLDATESLPSRPNHAAPGRQRDYVTHTTTEPQVLHQPAPYNMLALRDLYTQLPEQNGQLKRFGSELFLTPGTYRQNTSVQAGRSQASDIPPGPDYVVGPGDALTISLWGGISQTLTRTIDRDGKVNLPEAGPVQVAGLTLERVRGVIADSLKHQYRDIQVAVTISRLRSIRIYVVGDVQRPGAYDISSLSTSLNALFAAGGPTRVGSLRVLRHYRGSQLLGEIDLYDFLLHGVQSEDRLQSGDTVLVPPAGPQVWVYGAVKRPAIYELKGGTTLAAMLEEAGGTKVSAELSHIAIDRIEANQQRETISLKVPDGSDIEAAIAAFLVQDGDRVHVSAILPYSEKVVYAEGHIIRPGRMPYHDGMQLSDVLHSYRDLLPEPADRGEIVRLTPPDLHPETIEFNLPDVLIGNSSIALQPFDTVRIFGRYEADAPKVVIRGEVLHPGTYDLSRGMTAAELVRMAGGLKRDALLTEADLTSYKVVGGSKVVSERVSIPIGKAVDEDDEQTDVSLKPGDVLTIHQLTGWNDIGSSITIEGEIAHPGSYGFKQGERLSAILRRAGGFRDTSYPDGAVLIREDVRKLQEKTREELINQIETSSASARISPNLGSGDQSATLQLIAQQQTEVLNNLRNHPASGRMVIHISADIGSWENTPADIEVRANDVLRVPKRPGFVLISGQVYNPSAITYSPGKTAEWYLRRAGGATEIANKKEIFVVRANGSVVGHESGWFDHNVLSTRLNPGDAVVVPQKIIGASLFWKNVLTVAQIAASVAFTAAVAGAL